MRIEKLHFDQENSLIGSVAVIISSQIEDYSSNKIILPGVGHFGSDG
jgi:hypothetical protein